MSGLRPVLAFGLKRMAEWHRFKEHWPNQLFQYLCKLFRSFPQLPSAVHELLCSIQESLQSERGKQAPLFPQSFALWIPSRHPSRRIWSSSSLTKAWHLSPWCKVGYCENHSLIFGLMWRLLPSSEHGTHTIVRSMLPLGELEVYFI